MVEHDVYFSCVYGGGVYLKPSAGRDRCFLQSPFNDECWCVRLLSFVDPFAALLKAQVLSPPRYKTRIIWPVDLVHINDRHFPQAMFLENYYGRVQLRPERWFYAEKALLFDYHAYLNLHPLAPELKRDELCDWQTSGLQRIIISLLESLIDLNESGYWYLDFDMSRLWLNQEGEIVLDFSSLIFNKDWRLKSESVGHYTAEIGVWPLEFSPPSLVRGDAVYYDGDVQNYSLTSLLFFLMIGRHAFHGSMLDGYNLRSLDGRFDWLSIYHRSLPFIFDEEDRSNSIGDFGHEQVFIERWRNLPEAVKFHFMNTFANKEEIGIAPSPQKWLDILKEHGWSKS